MASAIHNRATGFVRYPPPLVDRLDDLDTPMVGDAGKPRGQRRIGDKGLDLAEMGDCAPARCAGALSIPATSMTLRALAMIACAACTSR